MSTNLKCFLCLNACGPDTENYDGESENFKAKLYLLINYVAATRNTDSSSFLFCENCKVLLESFSDLLEDLELARMKLDSCVQKICDVMLDGNQREKDIDVDNESIRKNILEKSYLKVKRSQPEVKVTKLHFVCGEGETPSTVVVAHPPPPTATATASSSCSSNEKIKIETDHGRKLPEFIWENGTVIRYKKEVTKYYCSICDKDFTSKDLPFHQSHSAFYERLCGTSNPQNPPELLETSSTSTPEPETNDLPTDTNCDTGIVVKTEREWENETTQEDSFLQDESLPQFIIRKSCVKLDDRVETLYHCNLCNRSFFNLHLHLKRHDAIADALDVPDPSSSTGVNQPHNLGEEHGAMEVDTSTTTTTNSASDESSTSTNAIGSNTTATTPETQERSETAVEQELEDVETLSDDSGSELQEQQQLDTVMNIDLGEIKLEREVVWSVDSHFQVDSVPLTPSDKGNYETRTSLTSGVVVPGPSQYLGDGVIIPMGKKESKDGKSSSYIYFCRKCGVTFSTSPANHRRRKSHQDVNKEPVPTPSTSAGATPGSSNWQINEPKSQSDKLKVIQTKKIERKRRRRRVPELQKKQTTRTNQKSCAELPDFITRKGTIHKFGQNQTLYYCSLCKMDFPSGNLTIHKRKHGIGRLACKKCDKTFYTKQYLIRHTKNGQCNTAESGTERKVLQGCASENVPEI